MGSPIDQASRRSLWRLVESQHGVVARAQLIELGVSPSSIKHRVRKGRLHPVAMGVYAVGRPELTPHGRWVAAVLRCGTNAALSHDSAAELWGIGRERGGRIEVSIPAGSPVRPLGIVVHRRTGLTDHVVERFGIPVTSVVWTLVDLGSRLPSPQLEVAVNEADKRELIEADELRSALECRAGSPGVAALRSVLDRRTFRLTDSELERRFLRLARRAGLPVPETGSRVNGFKVDFYWRDLGLIVETDGLRYHRTPGQQAKDRLRDQAHAAAGLTPLRFTHAQARYEPEGVVATLTAVVRRIRVRSR